MIVREYDNARTYLDNFEAILLEREAVSQLILHNAYQNLTTAVCDKCLFGAVLDDDENTILLFCNVAPYHLVIYIVHPEKDMVYMASVTLADFITTNLIPITGIMAKYDVCNSFIPQYKKNINCAFVEKQGMDIMEIRQVNEIKLVEGTHRLAVIDEVKLVTDWMIQFQMETLATEMDYEAALKKATNLVENEQVYIFEDMDHTKVSMAATTRKLKHGIAISYVFTPEEYRGNGYAAANIYYLSKELLDKGYEFCTLFVDKKNLVSSRAYEKVGYKIIDDNYEYKILPIEG